MLLWHTRHVVMHGVMQLLRSRLLLLLRCPSHWEEKLPYLEMVYNSSPQSRTKESPHYVVMHGVMQLLRSRLLLLRCPSQPLPT